MTAFKFFDYDAFHFETLRALWYAPAGGADFGEIISAVRMIKERDVNSWFEAWSSLAQRCARVADSHNDPVAGGGARLRASNYMRTAEFYLSPHDPRRKDASRFAQDQFFAGLSASSIEHSRLRVPYDGAEMEAIYLPARDAKKLFVIHGGFDSTPEEMFFMLGRAAQARGCDVLIYEGPGQGNLLRRFERPFNPAWGLALKGVLDAVGAKLAGKQLIGVGVSMGGHFLARAAAVEQRLDAIVLCDYFPAPIAAFKHFLPPMMRSGFENKAGWVLALMEMKARTDPQTKWVLDNAKWTFGASNLRDLVDRLRSFDEGDWVREIRADVLLMLGAAEHFFDLRSADVFAANLQNARSVTKRVFGADEGGELHCRNGAYFLVQDAIFDWLNRLGAATTDDRKRQGGATGADTHPSQRNGGSLSAT